MSAATDRAFRLKHVFADAFASAGLENQATNLRKCSETELLVFCSDCTHTWYVPFHCRSRVCPVCSAKTSRLRASFLEALSAEMAYPKFLTLTMQRWTADPRDGIDFLRGAFTRLRRSRLFRKVKGGAYQIELLRKPDGWHIHIHVLMDAPYIPYQKIFSAWRRLVGGYPPQVHIEVAATQAQRSYICKYTTKSVAYEGNLDDVVAWYLATQARRLFGTFGDWYNVKLEDFLNPDDGPPPKPACPRCGSTGTIVYARDGPFALGGECWLEYRSTVLRDLPFERPSSC
ncbi:MAG: protein rep [Candidatus Eisenbacteria sp.]|nr:protein rep [Candidatus Eisenbacteria bacterium]